MICSRCDKPIPPDDVETIPLYGASAGGGVLHVHRAPPCKRNVQRDPRPYPAGSRP
jgi:hypothetical protein